MRSVLVLAAPSLAAVLAAPLVAQLRVTAVQPPRNALAAATLTDVAITFDRPVRRATVTGGSLQVFGRWSGVARGARTFRDGDRTVVFSPDRPFFVGETVTVTASSAIAGTNGQRLVGGHAFSFWTRPAPGSRQYELQATIPIRRPGETKIVTYGAYAGDLDGDGTTDLSLPNEDTSDVRVLRGDGCGGFGPMRVHALRAGDKPSANEGQDFDGDGLTDLAVANIDGGTIAVLLGDGNGGYRPPAHYRSGAEPRGITVLDADGDGDADIVAANRVSSDLALFRNNGNGTFAAAATFDGGGQGETAVAAADANNDGIADLFVGNLRSRTLTLLLGDGAGGFRVTGRAGVTGEPWMIATGDVDGDGNVDVVSANSTSPRSAVVLGDGRGGLRTANQYAVGRFPLAVDLGDLDGDGDLDMVTASYLGADYTVHWNDGSGGFGSSTRLAAQRAGSCAVLVDHDRDGDLDVIGIDEVTDVVLVYRQRGPTLAGVQPPSCAASLRVDNRGDRGGFGARPPHAVPLGGRFVTGISGAPARSWVVVLAAAREPGAGTPFGLLNLDPTSVLVLPPGSLDARGNARRALPVPPGLPRGSTIALQGFVTTATGGALSNPERVVLR